MKLKIYKMKKLLGIILIGVMFTSCVQRPREVDVVIEVRTFGKYFNVRTETYEFRTATLYRVGDTLKISKK